MKKLHCFNQLSETRTVYFPGLNGVRAIAALVVVFSHITIALEKFDLDPFIFGTLANGKLKVTLMSEFGVTMFFVLSGFLITYLLLEEKSKAKIQIRKFYMRRILRIWPLYYIYLIGALVTLIVIGIPINGTSLLEYIFFASNIPFIYARPLPLLEHYWSLGVEEQFYLFWPWIVAKAKSLKTVLIALVVFMLAGKFYFHIFHPGSIHDMSFTITRFHCMMFGAIGAILYREENSVFLRLVDNKLMQLISWLVIFLSCGSFINLPVVINNEVISVFALFIIVGQANVKNRLIPLENRTFDFLGKISYGIYVIHPLMIFFAEKIIVKFSKFEVINYLTVYLIIVASTITLAYVSYNYFEKYFLNLKHKFEVVRSSNSKTISA